MNSKVVSFDKYHFPQTSNKQNIEYFLANKLNQSQREQATEIALDFYDPQHTLQSTVAFIPVAAHQESANIIPAISQYAKQQNNNPFSVLLLLNSPTSIDNAKVKDSLNACQEAKILYPNLDIRYCFREYINANIGQIRQDLWNSGLILAHHDGLLDSEFSDVIGLNHDIDITYLSPNYIHRVQKYYKTQKERLNKIDPNARLRPAFTKFTHSSPINHPNIAKVIFWADFMLLQAKNKAGFEASIAVPFSHYVTTNGFSDQPTYESQELLLGSHARSIPNTIGKTSPRRYVQRLQQVNLSEIWDPSTFGQSDACRDNIDQFKDISQVQMQDIIFESLENYIQHYCLWSAKDEFYTSIIEGAISNKLLGKAKGELMSTYLNEYHKKLATKLRLAKQVLKNNLELPLLAELVETSYQPKKIVQKDKLELSKEIAFWNSF